MKFVTTSLIIIGIAATFKVHAGEVPNAAEAAIARPQAELDGSAASVPAEQKPIPWTELGAQAGASYKGSGLAITPVPGGARLDCAFQKLGGLAQQDGLWLESTQAGAKDERFRVAASAVGRAGGHRTALPTTGRISMDGKLVRYARQGLVEEYSTSVDGIRQDFVIVERPVGAGALRLELETAGARVEQTGGEMQLVLPKSSRQLAYSRLHVEDSTGKKLPAHFELESPQRLVIQVEDAAALYPLRIDPTFSDANWQSMGGVAGVGRDARSSVTVHATAVDAAGHLYVGGSFTVAGNVVASNIAKWDGSQWSELGSGVNSRVNALLVKDGSLYAAGHFTEAGGVPVSRIARWDGNQWSALGSEIGLISSTVYALAAMNGDLYAAGTFTQAGGIAVRNIARWNGSQWFTLGSGGMDGTVLALTVMDSALYVGGSFSRAGYSSSSSQGIAANRIAKWDGSQWSSLGVGATGGNNVVRSLAAKDGNLYAGGTFTHAGGQPASNIAKWNGSQWSTLGGGINGTVYAMAFQGNDLYAGGEFGVIGVSGSTYIARWNGSLWSAVGDGILKGAAYPYSASVLALASKNDELYVGGFFDQASSVDASCIVKLEGNQWSPLGGATTNSGVTAIAAKDGSIYVAGAFTRISGIPANRIARWDGSQWWPLGTGTDGTINCLAFKDGILYAGGSFLQAGGVAAPQVAKWDGNSWSPVGDRTGMFEVRSFAVTDDGLYAAEYWRIAKWDGNQWTIFASGWDGHIKAMETKNNDLYVAGSFTSRDGQPFNHIAKWSNGQWSALGEGTDGWVHALAWIGDDLYAGGEFSSAGGQPASHIAKWNGSQWSNLGAGTNANGSVYALAALDGNLYVGGYFTQAGGVAASRLAKWDGSEWTALGSGANDTVEKLAVHDGYLYAAGSFFIIGNKVSPYVARAALDWSSNPELRLRVTSLTIPAASSAIGDTLEVSWRVTNEGNVPSDGAWTDRLYLAEKADLSGAVIRLHSEVVRTELQPGGSYTRTARVTLLNALPGNYHLVVQAADGLPALLNAPVRTSIPLSISWPSLAPGTERTGAWPESRWVFSTLNVPAGTESVELSLDSAPGSYVHLHSSWLSYPQQGAAATTSALIANSATQRLNLESPLPGTYFIAARLLNTQGTGSTYTLRVRGPEVEVTSSYFGRYERQGTGTLQVEGSRLWEVGRVSLRTSGGTEVAQHSSLRMNGAKLEAAFLFDGIPLGLYDVVFEADGRAPMVVPGGLEVVAAVPLLQGVVPRLVIPGAVRGGSPFPVRVQWNNTLGRDAPLPIFVLDSQIPLGMEPQLLDLGKRHLFVGFGSGGLPASSLLAGQSGEAVFYAQAPGVPGVDRLSVSRFVERRDDVFDWARIESLIRPPELDSTAFAPILAALKAQAGPTSADFARVLRESAALLPQTDSRWGLERLLRPVIDRLWAARGESISGSVQTDEAALQLVGRTVTARVLSGAEGAGITHMGTILTDGSFVFTGLAAGSYEVTVDGLAHNAITLQVTSGAPAVVMPVTVSRGVVLAGRLSSSAGGVVKQAALILRNTQDAAAPPFKVASSDQGSFEFRALPPAPYALEVWHAGHQPLKVDGIDLSVPGTLAIREITLIAGVVRTIEVKDATSGAPIAGVTVLASAPQPDSLPLYGQTEGNGSVVFGGIGPGLWTVMAAKPGYAPVEREIDLLAGPASVILTLTQTSGFAGKVVDTRGTGLQGLSLALVPADVSSTEATAMVVTDALGGFLFPETKPGHYVLELQADLMPLWRQPVDLSAGMPDNYALTLPVAGVLTGTFAKPSGQVLAGAEVFVMDEAGQVVLRMMTDDAGAFHALLLASRNYTVVAVAANGTGFSAPTVVDATAGDGGTHSLSLVAGEKSVTARLLKAPGDPLADAQVVLADSRGRIYGQAETNSSGTVVFSNVPGGDFLLEASTPTAYWSVAANTQPGPVQLGDLLGQALLPYPVIVRAAGTPVPGAIVQLERQGGIVGTAVTDDAGLAMARAPTGTGAVNARIFSPAFQVQVVENLTSGVTASGDLLLPVTSVSGRVRQSGTAAGIAAVFISAHDVAGNLLGFAETDIDGNFSLQSLPQENVILKAERAGLLSGPPMPVSLTTSAVLTGLVLELTPGAVSFVPDVPASESPAPFGPAMARSRDLATIEEVGLSTGGLAWWSNYWAHLTKLRPVPVPATGQLCGAKRVVNEKLRQVIAEMNTSWIALEGTKRFYEVEAEAAIGKAAGAVISFSVDLALIEYNVTRGLVSTVWDLYKHPVYRQLVKSFFDTAYTVVSEVLKTALSAKYGGIDLAFVTSQFISAANAIRELNAQMVINQIEHYFSGLTAADRARLSAAREVLKENILSVASTLITAYESATLLGQAFTQLTVAHERLISQAHNYVQKYNVALLFEESLSKAKCGNEEEDPPGGEEDDREDVDRRLSRDPNDIIGPSGHGDEYWTAADQPWGYMIRFENDPEKATAKAAVVRIEQAIDPDLDLESFRLGDFGFGQFFHAMEPGLTTFTKRFDLVETLGVLVDVEAGIDYGRRVVWWEFTSIDPETGMVPWNPDLGFLPLNTISPEGEGFVSYTIRPAAGLASGSRIDAQASIVFDVNEPIITPAIFNTVDNEAPVSSVTALAAETAESWVQVSWSGTDSGSGIASYDIWVSDNDGEWRLWLANVTSTSSLFMGETGHTYRFRSVAKDHARYTEAAIATAQATTLVRGRIGAWTDLARGVYDGVLTGAAPSRDLVGAIENLKISLPKKNALGGAATGVLRLKGKSIKLLGVIQTEGGHFTQNTPFIKEGVYVETRLRLAQMGPGGAGLVTGTVTWKKTGEPDLVAQVRLPQAMSAPENLRGTYTLLLPTEESWGLDEPGGDGWGTLSIASTGVVSVKGRLGDGTPFVETAYLSTEGGFSLYQELYVTKPQKGRIGGLVSLRDVPGVSDFDGTLHWVKLADAKEKQYAGGFDVRPTLLGSRFVAPPKGQRALAPLQNVEPNALLSLTGVTLPTATGGRIERVVSWLTTQAIKHYGPEKLSGTVDSRTGTLTCTFNDPVSRLQISALGVVFQKQGLAAGQFVLGTRSGALRIQPGTAFSYPGSEAAGPAVATLVPADDAVTPTLSSIAFLPGAAGIYGGVLGHASGMAGGIENLTVSSNGTFTGSLWVGGARHTLTGRLGVAPTTVTVAGMTVTLTLQKENEPANGYQLTGTVQNGATTYTLAAQRRPTYTAAQSAPQLGAYTIALPASTGVDATTVPGGDGYGTLSTGRTGLCTGALVLADGTKTTFGGHVTVAGEWSLYRGLYGGTPARGYLAGKMVFRNIAGTSDVDGAFRWVKGNGAPAKPAAYPSGFALNLRSVGSKYVAPAKGVRAWSNLAAQYYNAWTRFTGPSLSATTVLSELDRTVTWNTANQILYYGPDVLTLKVDVKTGLVTGSYKDVTKGVNQSFGGVLLQKQGMVTGCYATARGAGRFWMQMRQP